MTTIDAHTANFTIPFGMEITIDAPESARRNLRSAISKRYQQQVAASELFDNTFLDRVNADTDDGVFEFHTGLVRNMREAQICYEAARDAWPRKRVCTQLNGGGGHLHAISPTRYPDRFTTMLAFDLVECPYIGWSFLDPCDDALAATHLWQERYVPTETNCQCDECLLDYENELKHANCKVVRKFLTRFNFSKLTVINFASEYDIELRFFGTPLSWSEQRAHLLFADAWLARHCVQFRTKPNRIPRLDAKRASRPIASWTKREALSAMRTYIERDLRLSWSIFESLVERNLLNRFADSYGYRRT